MTCSKVKMNNIYEQKIHFNIAYYIPDNVASKKLTVTFEKQQKHRVLLLIIIKDISIINFTSHTIHLF